MVKNILLFVSGIIVGVVAVFIFAAVSSDAETEVTTEENGCVMFEQVGGEITSYPLQVIQVFEKGVALAREHKGEFTIDGLVVLLMAEDEHFYDDQIVKLSKGKCFKHVGVYTYETRAGERKTVPIVKALPK